MTPTPDEQPTASTEPTEIADLDVTAVADETPTLSLNIEIDLDDDGKAAWQHAASRYFTASEHEAVVRLREQIQFLAATALLTVPDGRNRSIALTALEDVQMRLNRGIFAPDEHR